MHYNFYLYDKELEEKGVWYASVDGEKRGHDRHGKWEGLDWRGRGMIGHMGYNFGKLLVR